MERLIQLLRNLAFEQEGFQRRSSGGGDQRLFDPFALFGDVNQDIATAIGQIDAFRLLSERAAEGVDEALARVALAEAVAPFAERFASTISESVGDSVERRGGRIGDERQRVR